MRNDQMCIRDSVILDRYVAQPVRGVGHDRRLAVGSGQAGAAQTNADRRLVLQSGGQGEVEDLEAGHVMRQRIFRVALADDGIAAARNGRPRRTVGRIFDYEIARSGSQQRIGLDLQRQLRTDSRGRDVADKPVGVRIPQRRIHTAALDRIGRTLTVRVDVAARLVAEINAAAAGEEGVVETVGIAPVSYTHLTRPGCRRPW